MVDYHVTDCFARRFATARNRLVTLEAGVVVVGALGDDDFEVHDDSPSALFLGLCVGRL